MQNINFNSYKSEASTIDICRLSNHGATEYIELGISKSWSHQNYPGIKLADINDGVMYLKSIFEAEKLEDIQGKKCISFCSHSDVFLLYNPENQKFFSLHAKFLSKEYEHIIDDKEQYSTNLNIEDLIIYSFLSKIPYNELIEEPLSLIKNKVLYERLHNEIDSKANNPTNLKVKI